MRLMDQINQEQIRFHETTVDFPEYLLIDMPSFEKLKEEYIIEMGSEIEELERELSVQDMSEIMGVTICFPVSKSFSGYEFLKKA